MTFLPFLEWMAATEWSVALHESLWMYPIVESTHVLALALFAGTAMMFDLRLLGLGLRDQALRTVGAAADRLMVAGIVVMLVTGIPLFLSEAVKCYYSQAFWLKILTLVPAMAFALTVRRWVVAADEGRWGPGARGLTALASQGMWFTVAAAGRWIGFS